MVKLGPFALDATLTGQGGTIVAALRLESPAQVVEAPPAAGAGGSLRDTMPHSAAVVDWVRGFLGREAADRVIARGKAGRGGAYFAEIGPDGQLREFGSTADGRRWAMVDGAPRWVDRNGTPIDAQQEAASA